MAQQGGRIDFQVGFKTDKSGIQELKKSLQDIQKIKPANFEGSKKDLQEIKSTASDVEKALSKAFNQNISSINLKTFDNELKATGRSINDIYTSFSKAGAQGQVAFSQMARSVLTTKQQLKETHSFITKMGETMMNTVTWGITSSIMNNFSSSVQGAFRYVESLEKSLTNIRIVTGDSQQKMEQFADSANRAAQELGRSTMDYSKAALTFYQQGLNDEDVQARTEAVLKAQNITGAGSQMADYLTAVWNGYKVANEEAQLYVDKLAAVADSSASDMSQLAVAMSKVASTANTMGVDVDQLNAQLATVVATTRQAPQAVGTAFKTIYTRLNDIKTGSDQAQVSLGRYSGQMAELGFNVLDASGHLRDTGQVMQEIGARWGDLTREQRIYLATTMGGQRQVNQLMALFDNWTTYSELLNTSLESEGTLVQKNSIYMESLGAKMEQLGAAGERVKASLIDTDSFKGVIDLLTLGTNLFGTFIESIGGGGTALLGLGGIVTQVFGGVISKEINKAIINFQNVKFNFEQTKKEIALTEQFGKSQGYSQKAINEMLDAKRQMQAFYSVMSTEQRDSYNAIVEQIGATKQQLILQQQRVDKAREYEQALTAVADKKTNAGQGKFDFQAQNTKVAEDTDSIVSSLKKIKNAGSESSKSSLLEGMIQQVRTLKEDLGTLADKDAFKELFTELEEFAKRRDELINVTDIKKGFQDKINNQVNNLKNSNYETQQQLEQLIKLEQLSQKVGVEVDQLPKKIADANREKLKQLMQLAKEAGLDVDEFLKKLKEADQELNLTQIKIKNRAGSINNQARGLIDNHTNADVHVAGVEQAQKKLEDLKRTAEDVQKQMSQGLTVSNIVQGVGELGRASSALMSLGNSIKMIFDDSIPPAEKFFKILISSGYAIPTLVTSFQKLKAITQAVSAATVNASKIQAANNAIKQAQAKIEQEATLAKTAGAAATGASTATTSASAAATGVDTVAKQADTVATTELTKAQVALDAAMSANPVGLVILAIAGLVAAVAGAIAIYDKFNTSVEEAGQAVNAFNEKVDETKNKVKQYNVNITGLEEARKEWDLLYQRGSSNVNNLTEEEQERYHELSNLIAQYNTDAIAGYDAQGNAIIAYNSALDETIEKLKEERQLIIDNTYDNKEFDKAEEGESILYQQAKKDKDFAKSNKNSIQDQLVENLERRGTLLATTLEGLNTSTRQLFADQQQEMNDIISEGADSIFKQRNTLIRIFQKFQEAGILPADYNVMSVGELERLNEYYKENEKELKRASAEVEKYQKLNVQKVLGKLQTTEYNQFYNKAKEIGIQNIDGILSNYIQGLNAFNKDGTRKKAQTVAQQINKSFFPVFLETLGKQDDITGVSLYDKMTQAFFGDDKIEKNDFANLEEKQQYIQEKIQNFFDENQEMAKKIKDAGLQQAFQQLFANMFNLDGIEIDFDNNKVKSLTDKKLNSLTDAVNKAIDESDIKNKQQAKSSISQGLLARLLPPDLTAQELDYIEKHLDQALEKTQNVEEAIKTLLSDGARVTNLTSNLDTASLLNKQSSGGKLSDKEQDSLETGLQALKNTYPGLIQQVRILQNEWLQGTDLYKDALSNVKGALIDQVGQGLEEQILTAEEAKEKITGLVTTTEDLERVSNQYFESSQLKSQILSDGLIKIASGYDSCKKALGDYTLALGTADQSSAEFALKRSTESAEMAAAFGLDAQRVQDLAANFSQLAQQYDVNQDASLKEYEGLNKDAQAAADAAVRYIRLNDAIADMQQNYDSMTEILRALGSAQGDLTDIIVDNEKAFKSLKKDIAGIINVSEDMINQDWNDWIQDNAGNLQAAMEGSQEAVDALRNSATEEIVMHLNIDTQVLESALGMSKEQVADWANNLEPGKLDVDDTQVVQKLTWLMQQAGYTADQIREYFKGMDLDVNLQPMNQSLEQAMANAEIAGDSVQNSMAMEATESSSTSTTEDAKNDVGFTQSVTSSEQRFQNQVLQQTGVSPFGFANVVAKPVETVVHQVHKEVKEQPIEATAVKENTVQALEVKRAGKTVGGKISHKNKSGGNKKSGGGGKKGKGKKGGGKKGKGSTPKAPKVEKPVTDKQDRYHDVNLKLKETDNQLKKIQEKQDKLTGPELLKNLEKQQKLLDKQVDTYKTKLELERQQRDEVRNRLAKQGALFDKNGNISNYSKLLSDALAEYNKTIADYNKMSAQEQEKHSDMIENAKKKYEGIKEDISRYDKIISEEIPGLQESIQKALDEKTQIEIQKFKTKVEVQVDLSEAERDFNEFQDKVKRQLRDDDVLGKGQSSIRDYNSYYKEGNDVVQALTDQIRNTKYEIDEIDQTGKSSIYGDNRAAALKDLKEYTDKLKDSLQDVEDIVANIKDSIFDAIDKAQDAFDKQEDEYEHISDLIQHNKDMIELLYGDDAYNELANFYKLQEENNKNQLDFLKQQQSLWAARLADQKARRDALPKDSNAWKEANERVEEYEKHWMDVTKKINSTVQKSIENIIDKYSNAIDKTFKKLEDKLTKNKGLDYINEEWELINDKADMYLDKVNSMYEIDKLGNAYQEAIKNNEGNVKAQRSLNNMMNEQLKYLKDKDKLTQYDVDRANALLQIEIKRLALEQQRQSKTKLRLRRDAQGNYTYQYTADEQANEQAKQELADAENSLYNMTKEAYKNNLDTYYDTVDEWQDKVKDVYKDTTLTVEQQQKKVALLNEYYGDIITDLTKDNEDLKKFMMEDTFNEMAKMYDTNVENYKKMTQATKDTLMGDMIPYWKSGVQEMADSVKKSQQQFIPYVQGTFDELNTYYKSFQNSLKSLQQQAGITFNDLVKGVDENINRTQGLLESNKAMVDSYTKEITAVRQLITEVQQLIDTYHLAKQEALDAIQTMDQFLKEDSRRTATNTNTKTNTNTNTSKNNSGAYSMSNHAVPLKTNTTASKDAISLINNSTKRLSSFATGGYTGDWGDNGRIGILHEKELILNEEDTQNILSAVRVTRTLNSILESFKFDSSDFDIANLLRGGFMKPTESNTEQHIVINADFPSVKSTYEIEAAFDNLVNRASQFAFNNRK